MQQFFSKDFWMVALLVVTAITASVYFAVLPGPVAENLGLVPSAQYAQVVGSTKAAQAIERNTEHLKGIFGPDAVLPREGRGVFEGELQIIVAEAFEEGEGLTKADHFYYLHDEVTGIVLELRPKDDLPPGLEAGAMLRARGVVQNGIMEVDSAAAAGLDGSYEMLAPAEATATAAATRSALAIVINTSDANVPCSVDGVRNSLFNTPGNNNAEAYMSATHDNLTFAGDVIGPFTVSNVATDNYGTIGAAGRAAAEAAGYDLSGYDHIIHYIPDDPNTGYVGVAYYNGVYSFVLACNMLDVVQHELGHNLNLGHSGRNGNEYADMGSFMGYGNVGLRHAHAAHMHQSNWLADSQVISNPGPGTYTLSSSDIDAAIAPHPQAIMFDKSDTNEKYYLSYRTPEGYADNMPSANDNMTQLHVVGQSSRTTTWLQRFMTDGQDFNDSVNGISIKQISSVPGESATYEISTNCSANAPTVSIAPSEVGSNPGGTANYSVSVRNNDSSTCGESTINLTSTTNNANLNTSLSQASVSLAPGATTNVTLTATSDASITGDIHTVTVVADRNGETNSASANYLIDGTAPTTPTNVVAELKRKQINVTWNASLDNVGVVGYYVFRNGAQIGSTQSTSFADRSADAGTNTYTVQAYDAAGNVSAMSAPATVDSTGSGGGGGNDKPGGGSGGGGNDKCSPWPSCRNN